MAVNKAKGLWIAAGGMAASALPYLPQITTALHGSGASPKVVSLLTAATIIYQAFKADPHKSAQTTPLLQPAAPLMPQGTDILPQNVDAAPAQEAQ